MHDKLSEAGAKLLSETLPKLIRGELTPIPQDNDEATFASNIKREQEKIDWTQAGEESITISVGLNPWPVAYTRLDGKVLKIWKAEKVSLLRREPGTIAK